MVNFKLGEEIRKDGIFNMSGAWDKEKIRVPDGNGTHDLPYTGRTLSPLSSMLSGLSSNHLAVCRTRVTTNSVNMTYVRHESPSSSVVRASDRCTEGHGLDSRRGTQILSLSHARDMLNIPSFLNSKDVIRKKIDSLRQVLSKSQIRKTL